MKIRNMAGRRAESVSFNHQIVRFGALTSTFIKQRAGTYAQAFKHMSLSII